MAVDEATGVAVITLNNPKALNALSGDMGDQFEAIIDSLCTRSDVGAVVITGAGRAFSAGGDLGFLQERAFNSTPEENTNTMRKFYSRFLSVRRLPMPSIAAVNGHAIGAAFSFALATDMRIIAENAKCSVNFTNLGLHPGMGATFILPRSVRQEVANYLLLTGKQIMGREAHELGLCLKCKPKEEVLPEAMEIARAIAANGRLAVRQTKESLSTPFEEGMVRQLRREADAQAVSYVDFEFRERLTALVARTTGKVKKAKGGVSSAKTASRSRL